MLELEDAIKILLENAKKISEVEEKNLLSCVGKICAENYFANFDNPPFNRSPLDGFTFNSAETFGATEKNPKKFKIIGEECAGDFFSGEIFSGECLRIMTSAAIPKNCDCVIRQEDVKIDGENIFVPYELKHHENFCFAGEDIKKGAPLIEKNRKISAAHVAVLASQGISKIKIYRAPKIAIASTGDELINPDEKLSAGKIFNSNLFLIAARLIELGIEPKILGNLPDDAKVAAEKISAENFDILITTGGVSVGKKDIMHEVAKISCDEKILYRRASGILADNFPKKSGGRRFIRGKFADGKIFLPEQHASGSLFSAVDCNCLIDIPAGSDKLKIGDKVEVILL